MLKDFLAHHIDRYEGEEDCNSNVGTLEGVTDDDIIDVENNLKQDFIKPWFPGMFD